MRRCRINLYPVGIEARTKIPCMGRSLSRGDFILFAFFALSAIFLLQFFCSAPAEPILPSRPPRSERRRAQRRSRMARFRATASAARSVLDGREHDGRMRRLGNNKLRIALRNRGEGRGSRRALRRERGLGLTSRVRRQLQPTKSEASSPLRWSAHRAPRPCIRSILWRSNEP